MWQTGGLIDKIPPSVPVLHTFQSESSTTPCRDIYRHIYLVLSSAGWHAFFSSCNSAVSSMQMNSFRPHVVDSILLPTPLQKHIAFIIVEQLLCCHPLGSPSYSGTRDE